MSVAVMDHAAGHVTISHPSGTIAVPNDAVMRFTTPMWGFDGHVEFALLPAARRGVWWLIAVGEAPTTFVLADPFVVQAGYGIDINAAEREELQLENDSDALALVMLTLASSVGAPVTANFRAPLIFNLAKRLAKQVVNRDEAYSLSQPVDLTVYPNADDAHTEVSR
jgi:flagellar assembly factor FliW